MVKSEDSYEPDTITRNSVKKQRIDHPKGDCRVKFRATHKKVKIRQRRVMTIT